jgi:hypothetical protein
MKKKKKGSTQTRCPPRGCRGRRRGSSRAVLQIRGRCPGRRAQAAPGQTARWGGLMADLGFFFFFFFSISSPVFHHSHRYFSRNHGQGFWKIAVFLIFLKKCGGMSINDALGLLMIGTDALLNSKAYRAPIKKKKRAIARGSE